jgi:hypothetical protein
MSSSSAFIGWFCVTCAFPCLQSENLAHSPPLRHQGTIGGHPHALLSAHCADLTPGTRRGVLCWPLYSPHPTSLRMVFWGLLGEGACMMRLSVLQCTHNSG